MSRASRFKNWPILLGVCWGWSGGSIAAIWVLLFAGASFCSNPPFKKNACARLSERVQGGLLVKTLDDRPGDDQGQRAAGDLRESRGQQRQEHPRERRPRALAHLERDARAVPGHFGGLANRPANREPVPDFPSYGGYATEASQVKQLTAIAKVLADKGAI